MTEAFRAGLIAVVGRPNVGKSTLVNRLVGEKVSITSRRPQTTRHRLLGIKTTDAAQFVYVDTPGYQTRAQRAIDRYMNRAATGSLAGVDGVILVIAASGWRPEDEAVLALLGAGAPPALLAVNKVDLLDDKTRLLPLIDQSRSKGEFADIVPVSAQDGANLEALEAAARALLPQQPALFPPAQTRDRPAQFMAAELVREQVFRALGDEVPYATAVEIARMAREKRLLRVEAVIWVEKEGQKAIVIGKGGARLKDIGTRARLAMEKLFGRKVYLGVWVKVRERWSDDPRLLARLGYAED